MSRAPAVPGPAAGTGASHEASRPLRIAQVAPLWLRVPPPGYGGAELIVHWLTEELVRLGHHVTLFASADSTTSGELCPTSDLALVDMMNAGRAYVYEGYAVSGLVEALARADEFDIVHSHVGPLGIPLGALVSTPVVHTVHAGLASVDEHWLLQRYPAAHVVGISASQVASIDAPRRASIPVVYHGLDLAAYEPTAQHDGFVAFLGRMGPHKNPAGAIQVARAAGLPIVLAGAPQDGSERRYFDDEVRPLLGLDGVTYVGEVSQERKVDLLRRAAALLFPIRWDEHFGLVMIEAMACGTPVVALRRGSVPEVVDDGLTGFVRDTEEELVSALGRVAELDRRLIERETRARFGARRMTDDYVRVYQELARSRESR